uniref:Large ribosomal subunit protein mL42 n=1 Tax=Setaria digitata TaxID=48799 RepID=A0A915PNG3_9BILA
MDDGVFESGTVACWHPEESFPYHHSKSIDLDKIKTEKQSSSVLSKETEHIADLRGSLARTGPRNYTLREIFYTGKHEWYTRYREERLRSVAAPDPKRRN